MIDTCPSPGPSGIPRCNATADSFFVSFLWRCHQSSPFYSLLSPFCCLIQASRCSKCSPSHTFYGGRHYPASPFCSGHRTRRHPVTRCEAAHATPFTRQYEACKAIWPAGRSQVYVVMNIQHPSPQIWGKLDPASSSQLLLHSPRTVPCCRELVIRDALHRYSLSSSLMLGMRFMAPVAVRHLTQHPTTPGKSLTRAEYALKGSPCRAGTSFIKSKVAEPGFPALCSLKTVRYVSAQETELHMMGEFMPLYASRLRL